MNATLRILNVVINDSSNIDVSFTDKLTHNLVAANASILSQTQNVPNSQVLQVSVSGNVLSIVCQPLTPYAAYFLTFQSTSNNPFISVNGTSKISEDGVSNQQLITGPLPSDNPVQDFLQSFYRNNIYNANDPTTVVSKYLQSIAVNFSRALYDIRQLKNENYLSFTIIDELQTRGVGPFDRLNESPAYEVLRVGLSPTLAPVASSIILTDFPSYPVTLQRQIVTEKAKASTDDSFETFNINTFTFNLGNHPVTRVDSIVFTLLTPTPTYTYDIETLGYQILDSRYDQDYASSYLLLEDNQIRLNSAILSDPNFALNSIFSVSIQYEYKNLGTQIDSTSVNVFATLRPVREVLPPIINVFSLQHAPITDASDNAPTTGGVTFIDPNSSTGASHPAFVSEIPFSLSAPPASPGVYSVDYTSGTVYVYGADSNNDGTGPSPPLATYYYRFTYTSEIDFVYDEDLRDIVALPYGNLINSAGTVAFNYEQVLVPGVDYVADTHVEAMSELVGNKLIALNALTTQNSPITNVFQIYNETSGEIYLLDRWYDNKVYFKYNTPPRITRQTRENATFSTVTNELLGITSITMNTDGYRVFTIDLANNTIIGSTQDSIASSINTSLTFANGNVFVSERWYNQEFNAAANINNLSDVGEYTADYANGIVYVAVANTQSSDVGTATYKMNSIIPKFPHVISVDDIYYSVSPLTPKNKRFSYVSFIDGAIIPETPQISDEAFLNGVLTSPYQMFYGQVGAFVGGPFVAGVSNVVKFVRGVFEYNDLVHSVNPMNFAFVSTSNNYNITVGSINRQSFESIQYDDGYFVVLNENIPYTSPNIVYNFVVVRTSDSQTLAPAGFEEGNPIKLWISSSVGSPQVGDLVSVTYSFTITTLSRVIVDYNKGDYFLDYTYVADELRISYEYGDNVLDFRPSTVLSNGDNYYVSYRVGALRDALLKNFGTLVNIPDLSTFDLTLERERYRDALQAALSSFILGPTVAAIKNIGRLISHVEPEVIESAFEAWSLGSSLLFPVGVETTGSFRLLSGHFGNGVLVDQPSQTITMPVNSNLRLEEGTFETWVLPQWNGLDNDASLSFTITRDGLVIDPFRVFIGGSEYHPAIIGGVFTLGKNSNVSGNPNTNKDGVFIYYDDDASGNFRRWYLRVIDGYVASNNHTYRLQIVSSGKFFDVTTINTASLSNITTFTGTNKINMTLAPLSGGIDEGLSFISDLEHYILDFGLQKDANRLSIYKDVGGYMNFRVYDRAHAMYVISADISDWKENTAHMVAASWKLNTRNRRDEMHLFIDGFEVPNIIKHGEQFRTFDPSDAVGIATYDIIGSTDLITTAGSHTVTSSINFGAHDIIVGNKIFIDELGFDPAGYSITGINSQSLVLASSMPSTMTNGKFSVNRTAYQVSEEINVVPNIAVTTIPLIVSGTDLVTTANLTVVSSSSINFTNAGVLDGYLLMIDGYETSSILQVNGHSLTLADKMLVSLSNVSFRVYSDNETEIPGVRALVPDYSISQDGYYNNILTISNGVLAGDLILMRTLGLNFQDVKQRYYVWSDNIENVLMTRMPPPVSLDQADITKIILPNTNIGPSTALIVGGVYDGYNLPTAQPVISQSGRYLQATVSGTKGNVDFSTPVQVTINGVVGVLTTSETLTFTDYGTKTFANQYVTINYVQVNAKPSTQALLAKKNAIAIEVKEEYPLTYSEDSGLVPVVKFSYHIGAGYNLSANGYDNMVTDGYSVFSSLDVGNCLIIHSPPAVAGFYLITGLSADRHSLTIQATVPSFPVPLPDFTGGVYEVLNTTQYRSGLQNGFFTLEIGDMPSEPYFLNHGFYEADYATYASIKFDSLNDNLYFGSDFTGNNRVNAILDQLVIYSIMMTDTRVGEVVSGNKRSITKDFNSLKAPKADTNTLVLVDFDETPFTNSASFYASTNNDHQHFQSDWAVNDNFKQSIVVLDKPIIVPNEGVLDNRKQSTIEFWMSPLFDTANDPQERFYLDAFGAVVEEVTSVSNVAVKVSSPASKIIGVTLAAGDPSIDYFAGGKLEIDTQNAIQEDCISIGTGSVTVSQPILQVITVKAVGDLTNTDYFNNGEIGTDGKTIYLGTPLPTPSLHVVVTYQTTANRNMSINTQVIRLNRRLPAQNSKVKVAYIPNGLQGDRICLFKDEYGYINFAITASNTDYVIRGPTRWAKNTWHRVKAQYKMNGGLGHDEMRLFLDGYEYTDVLFGQGLVCGPFPMVMGSVSVGDGYGLIGSINFRDPINNVFIGTDYMKTKPIFTLLDNFRISNVFRPIYAPYGEPIDVNYSGNLSTVFPVTKDLYTTYLMDFDEMVTLNTNFTTLIDRVTGSFDFTVNIFDSFDIVSSSPKVKEVLETLLNILKPGTSRMYIKYIG